MRKHLELTWLLWLLELVEISVIFIELKTKYKIYHMLEKCCLHDWLAYLFV